MTKRLTILFILITIPTAATASVTITTRVCEADGNTPFDYRDIMVGTKLTIIGTGEANGFGDLTIVTEGANRDYGHLSGRDCNEQTSQCPGSVLPDAGQYAIVIHLQEEIWDGYEYSGSPMSVAGDWFIIDYTATAVGDCNVAVYEYLSNEPNYYISFYHVPTRDFNQNTIVDFPDFAILAYYWQQSCSDPNWCEGADLNTNGDVNAVDLGLFCDYWLEKTE